MAAESTRREAVKPVRIISSVNDYLAGRFLGGPRLIKQAWVINLHKFLTGFVVAGLMIFYKNYSTAAWIYLVLHGTYGLCWLLKHIAFRDPKWETRATFGGAVFLFLLLATYWVAPFLLISDALGRPTPVLPDWYIALVICIYVLGLTVMTASDCQKNITLRFRKDLITDGIFRHVRHPNYLGEMMIYASFALLVRHWIPWAILAYWWIWVFLTNMLTIEASLSRYPQWEAYRSRTGMILPWKVVFPK
jgi:protein-S-isoprenylcysteine O-methyltransferase Ste14